MVTAIPFAFVTSSETLGLDLGDAASQIRGGSIQDLLHVLASLLYNAPKITPPMNPSTKA